MSKQQLIQMTALISGLIAIVIAVNLSIWQPAHGINMTPTSIPAIVPIASLDTTPSLGLSISDSTGTSMVYVPAGCFMMGSDDPYDDVYSGGVPFKMCFSNGYWIDKTDVTNATYQKFIDAGGYGQQGTWWSDAGWFWLHSMNTQHPYNYDGFTDAQQPRVGVMWYEAYAYCRWRGARLPTEPEWEYAARGPNSLIYPWGNTFDSSRVVYADNSNSKIRPSR